MRCDKCGKEAFMEINVMSEKENEVLHLCMDCYKKILSENNSLIKNLSSDSSSDESSKNIKDFLQYIFMNVLNMGLSSDMRKDPSVVNNTFCSKCGYSLQDFLMNDKLGCSECYNVFRAQIKEKLNDINNNSIYVGDCPDDYNAYKKLKEEYINLNDEITTLLFQEKYEALKEKTNRLEEIKIELKNMEDDFHE